MRVYYYTLYFPYFVVFMRLVLFLFVMDNQALTITLSLILRIIRIYLLMQVMLLILDICENDRYIVH